MSARPTTCGVSCPPRPAERVSRLGRLAVAGVLLAGAVGAQAAVCRVAPNSNPGNSGNSWDVPADLQTALGTASCTEIWLKQGTYTSASSFQIKRNLSLLGGYVGDPAGVDDARSTPVDASLTVLDGQSLRQVLNIDGTTTGGSIGESTLIEGLTIANGKGLIGGGASCKASLYNANPVRTCSPTFRRVVFSGNSAAYGGGLALDAGTNQTGKASPHLIDVVFDGNSATSLGGAMYVWVNLYGQALPVIERVTFSNNRADKGGAIYNSSGSQSFSAVASPQIINATFQGNSADLGSSVGGNGGAIYNDGQTGTNAMSLTNVTFSGNTANQTNHVGGAMVNFGAEAKPVITNVIFWGNQSWAPSTNELVNMGGGAPAISNSIIKGGCPLGASCTGVLDQDPLLAALADNGGFGKTMTPALGSPAIDAGASSGCPSTDERGITRPQGGGCDIGAVERRAARVALAASGPGNVLGTASGSTCDTSAGSGSCSMQLDLEGAAPAGVALQLTASPSSGASFVQWGGDCSGTHSPLNLTLNGNLSCSASFRWPSYSVGTEVTPSGVGGNIDCTPNPVDHGGSTQCTAHPPAGYFTQSISGCGGTATGEGVNSYTTGGITSLCTVTAQFALRPVTFSGTTVPSQGAGGMAHASMQGGGEACRFDLANTAFVAAPAALPAGQTLPQGMFQFQLIGCDTSPVTMQVAWPQRVWGYTKYGPASAGAEPSYFAPDGLSLQGNTVAFIVTDGQKGDDDWEANGTIVDPSGPTQAISVPAPVPTLAQWGVALLGLALFGLGVAGLQRRRPMTRG